MARAALVTLFYNSSVTPEDFSRAFLFEKLTLTFDFISANFRLNLVCKEAKMVKPVLTYLDTYVLQQDMRIRLPKSILANLNVKKGTTKFDIYLDVKNKELVCRIHQGEK